MTKHRRSSKDKGKLSYTEFNLVLYNALFRKLEGETKGLLLTKEEWLEKIRNMMSLTEFAKLEEERERIRKDAINRLLLDLGEEPTG